jgi:isopenicillin-N epimerase
MAGRSNELNDAADLKGFQSTRRDFFKVLSAVAAGAVTFGIPGMTTSDSYAAGKGSGKHVSWEAVQHQFMLGNLIYMNTGTEGSMPRPVFDSLCDFSKRFTMNPWNSINSDTDLNIFQTQNRQKAADFLGAQSFINVVLANNTTWGLSAIIHGLDLRAGDTVITTMHENSAGTSPLHLVRDRLGIVVKAIALPTPATNSQEIVDAFEAAINSSSNVKVLSFCHINYTTGLTMPVREICDLARSYGLITIVDGAHAAGMLNFSVSDLGCDYYPCAGHKWLCAPPGTGMLYMKPGTSAGMIPAFGQFPSTPSSPNLNVVWPMINEVYDIMGLTIPSFPQLDTSIGGVLQIRGQLNAPAFAAMSAAMDFQNSIGRQNIEDRTIALSRHLRQQVANEWGVNSLLAPAYDAPQDLMSGIAGFNPFSDWTDATKPAALQSQLYSKYNIVIRTLSFNPDPSSNTQWNVLRVSTHIYNDFDQIDKLIAAMKQIIRTM